MRAPGAKRWAAYGNGCARCWLVWKIRRRYTAIWVDAQGCFYQDIDDCVRFDFTARKAPAAFELCEVDIWGN